MSKDTIDLLRAKEIALAQAKEVMEGFFPGVPLGAGSSKRWDQIEAKGVSFAFFWKLKSVPPPPRNARR
jgi:hypothetical protein